MSQGEADCVQQLVSLPSKKEYANKLIQDLSQLIGVQPFFFLSTRNEISKLIRQGFTKSHWRSSKIIFIKRHPVQHSREIWKFLEEIP